MKVSDIITEAHHSIMATRTIGQWTVQIDSHAFVSAIDRNVPMEVFSSMISYMCFLPDVLPTIPVGRGAYFQDTNTKISLYVTRIANNTIRIDTVLAPTMKPKAPLFRREIPAMKLKPSQKPMDTSQLRSKTKTLGRDAVSQDIEQLTPLLPANREQRRLFAKKMRRLK
jgi:hypothetical protein